MKVTIEPNRLHGAVEIPSSKSYAHRILIASALSNKPTSVFYNATNQDIEATLRCLKALGVEIEPLPGGVRVLPVKPKAEIAQLNCGESGSTLRFMLPVAAVLGASSVFIGEGRLPERPNKVLTDVMRLHGVSMDRDLLPIALDGQLQGGSYSLPGNVSSQYITGLMFALPLCDEDSKIRLTTVLESSSYIDMTLDILKQFGIQVTSIDNGWRIPGGQVYQSPGEMTVEGDWSSAAFWLAAKAMGNMIEPTGLNDLSRQGDRAMRDLLEQLSATIDVRETPDLAPALAVAAGVYPGKTHITGAARLRIKESDRLRAIANMVNNLGGHCEEEQDGLWITGVGQYQGGAVDGCNDHRIVMAAAIAATRSNGYVEITDAQAVAKSYPSFFTEYERLGGIVHVEQDR